MQQQCGSDSIRPNIVDVGSDAIRSDVTDIKSDRIESDPIWSDVMGVRSDWIWSDVSMLGLIWLDLTLLISGEIGLTPDVVDVVSASTLATMTGRHGPGSRSGLSQFSSSQVELELGQARARRRWLSLKHARLQCDQQEKERVLGAKVASRRFRVARCQGRARCTK